MNAESISRAPDDIRQHIEEHADEIRQRVEEMIEATKDLPAPPWYVEVPILPDDERRLRAFAERMNNEYPGVNIDPDDDDEMAAVVYACMGIGLDERLADDEEGPRDDR